MNDQRTQQLFIQVMEKLSGQGRPYEYISDILMETCQFFRFGCGFIYQTNHENVFFLHESYAFYDENDLVPSFNLSDILSPGQMEELLSRRALTLRSGDEMSEMERSLYDIFHENQLLLVPVIDTGNRMVGLVGMSDRRNRSSLTENDIECALSVLQVVANQVKLQVYQQRAENTHIALESMLDNMGIDVYVNDFYTHEILYVNYSMSLPYGGLENMLGQPCWKALYEDRDGPCDYCPLTKLLDENGNPTKIYSWDYQRPFDGSWFRVISSAFRWVDGRLAHVVSSVDITENKRNESLIRQMAEYDELTSLPNRRKLLDDMDATLDVGDEGYVLFFDLDKFKRVNDEFGHRAGDDLLVFIGNLLQSNPLTKGKVYRYSGDEFVVITKNQSKEELYDIVQFISQELNRDYVLKDGTVHTSASIGIAHHPGDGVQHAELIHDADLAMYESKRKGTAEVHFYNRGNIISLSQWLEQNGMKLRSSK